MGRCLCHVTRGRKNWLKRTRDISFPTISSLPRPPVAACVCSPSLQRRSRAAAPSLPSPRSASKSRRESARAFKSLAPSHRRSVLPGERPLPMSSVKQEQGLPLLPARTGLQAVAAGGGGSSKDASGSGDNSSSSAAAGGDGAHEGEGHDAAFGTWTGVAFTVNYIMGCGFLSIPNAFVASVRWMFGPRGPLPQPLTPHPFPLLRRASCWGRSSFSSSASS